jgi:hypothetical protein
MGHFETNSDAYLCASIGLILPQELTFWRLAAPFSSGHRLEQVADREAALR